MPRAPAGSSLHDIRRRDIVASGEILTLFAELGAVVAGFSGIVVALDSEPVRGWPRLRREGLRTLLQVSAVFVAFSILPLILGRWFSEPGLWTWALAAYGLVHLLDVLSFVQRHTTDTPLGAKVGGRIGLGLAVAQIATAFLAASTVAEIAYIMVLSWHLAIASGSFAYLLYTHDTDGT